jgi:hypothetical protein
VSFKYSFDHSILFHSRHMSQPFKSYANNVLNYVLLFRILHYYFFPSLLHISSLKRSFPDTKHSHFLLFEHPCFWNKHYNWFDYRTVYFDSELSWYWFLSQESVEH